MAMLIILFYENSKEISCGKSLSVLIKDITVVRDYAEYFDNSPLGNTSLVSYTLVININGKCLGWLSFRLFLMQQICLRLLGTKII